MPTDFQFRAEQRSKLYFLRLAEAKPEKLQDLIRQVKVEMVEEDIAIVDKQIAEDTRD